MNGNVFPTELLKPEYSVLCLFAAHYTGEHDVQFVRAAGCKDVLLIDNNAKKLTETSVKHGFKGKCCDAFDFITMAAATGMLWDVVIADQWTDQDQEINVLYFDQLQRIARRHLVLGYCKRGFGDKMIEPGRYVHRSDHLGGVYWRIIDL